MCYCQRSVVNIWHHTIQIAAGRGIPQAHPDAIAKLGLKKKAAAQPAPAKKGAPAPKLPAPNTAVSFLHPLTASVVHSQVIVDATDPAYTFSQSEAIADRGKLLDAVCSAPLILEVHQCFEEEVKGKRAVAASTPSKPKAEQSATTATTDSKSKDGASSESKADQHPALEARSASPRPSARDDGKRSARSNASDKVVKAEPHAAATAAEQKDIVPAAAGPNFPLEARARIGEVRVDLRAFLQGRKEISGWFPVVLDQPAVAAPAAGAPTTGAPAVPEVQVTISVSEPLVTEQHARDIIATVAVDGLFALPNTWSEAAATAEAAAKDVKDASKRPGSGNTAAAPAATAAATSLAAPATAEAKTGGSLSSRAGGRVSARAKASTESAAGAPPAAQTSPTENKAAATAAAASTTQPASAIKKKGKTTAELYRDSFALWYSIPITASEDNAVRSDKAQLARGAGVPAAAVAAETKRPSSAAPDAATAKPTATLQLPAGAAPAAAVDGVVIPPVSISLVSSGGGDAANSSASGAAQLLRSNALLNFSRASYLTEAAAGRWRAQLQQNSIFAVHVQADRTPVDEKEAANKITLYGKALVDLRPLLKPGTTSVTVEVPVKRADPPAEVLLREQAEREAAEAKAKKQGKKLKKPEERVVESFEEARTTLKFSISLNAPLVPRKPKPTVDELLSGAIAATAASVAASAPAEKSVATPSFRDSVKDVAAKLVPLANSVSNSKELVGKLQQQGLYQSLQEQLKPALVQLIHERFFNALPSDSQLRADGSEPASTPQDRINALLSQLDQEIGNALAFDTSVVLQQPPLTLEDVRNIGRLAALAELHEDHALASRHHQNRIVELQGRQAKQSSASSSHASLSLHDHGGVAGQLTQALYEFGAFHMRRGDLDKAEECFREALALSPAHVPSLLGRAVLLCEEDQIEDAQPFVQAASEQLPNHPLVLVVRGLYHDLAEEDEDSKRFFEAFSTSSLSTSSSEPDPLVEAALGAFGNRYSLPLEQSDSAESYLARYLLGLNLIGLASRVLNRACRLVAPDLAEQHAKAGPGTAALILPALAHSTSFNYAAFVELANLLMLVGQLEAAQRALNRAADCSGTAPPPPSSPNSKTAAAGAGEQKSAPLSRSPAAFLHYLATVGHLHFLSGNAADAESCYQRYLDQLASTKDSRAVLDPKVCHRLSALFESQAPTASDPPAVYAKALKLHQQMCTHPTLRSDPFSWRGLATILLRLGKPQRADEALTEAMLLDSTDPRSWAVSSLIGLARVAAGNAAIADEARQSFTRALKLDLQDISLLKELGATFSRLNLEDLSVKAWSRVPKPAS